MCGIAGSFGNVFDPLNLQKMSQSIANRGPDQSVHWTNPTSQIAFHRLAIHGGSAGMQPFMSEDKKITVFCNGEIYNHKELRLKYLSQIEFHSESDCEVLPHLYKKFGLDFVHHLNGMYFMVIIDEEKKKAILIRDRLGIKPAFWTKEGDLIHFASEIKALKAIPGLNVRFDIDAALTEPWLNGHLTFDLTLPKSLFHNVESLPGGHYLEINLNSMSTRLERYWDIPAEDPSIHLDDAQSIYFQLLSDAVRICTRDVDNYGVFLSGGVDSQTLAKLASPTIAATCKNVATLRNGDFAKTVEFANQNQLDLLVSDYPIESNHLSSEHWRRLLEIYESPFFGPEQIFKFELINRAKRICPTTKVWLTGQGSDEFNGGYSTSFAGETDDYESGWEFFLFGLEQFNVRGESRGDAFLNYRLSKMRDLQMFNLWHEDRTTSWYGLETRVPFLDHKLVEWTFKIPNQLHAQLFWNKRILRNSISELLGDFNLTPKRPFFYGSGESEIFNFLNRSVAQVNPNLDLTAHSAMLNFRQENMNFLSSI